MNIALLLIIAVGLLDILMVRYSLHLDRQMGMLMGYQPDGNEDRSGFPDGQVRTVCAKFVFVTN